MKKIIKPAEKEESMHYSDFSGKCFGEFQPPVQVKIDFNYGSVYDGAQINLDLTEEEAQLFLNVIKANMSSDYKTFLQKQLKKHDEDFQSSCDFRDWTSCDYICNSLDLLKNLLDVKEEQEC